MVNQPSLQTENGGEDLSQAFTRSIKFWALAFWALNFKFWELPRIHCWNSLSKWSRQIPKLESDMQVCICMVNMSLDWNPPGTHCPRYGVMVGRCGRFMYCIGIAVHKLARAWGGRQTPPKALWLWRTGSWWCLSQVWFLSGWDHGPVRQEVGFSAVDGMKGFSYLVGAAGSSWSGFPSSFASLWVQKYHRAGCYLFLGGFSPILENLSSAWAWVGHPPWAGLDETPRSSERGHGTVIFRWVQFVP